MSSPDSMTESERLLVLTCVTLAGPAARALLEGAHGERAPLLSRAAESLSVLARREKLGLLAAALAPTYPTPQQIVAGLQRLSRERPRLVALSLYRLVPQARERALRWPGVADLARGAAPRNAAFTRTTERWVEQLFSKG